MSLIDHNTFPNKVNLWIWTWISRLNSSICASIKGKKNEPFHSCVVNHIYCSSQKHNIAADGLKLDLPPIKADRSSVWQWDRNLSNNQLCAIVNMYTKPNSEFHAPFHLIKGGMSDVRLLADEPAKWEERRAAGKHCHCSAESPLLCSQHHGALRLQTCRHGGAWGATALHVEPEPGSGWIADQNSQGTWNSEALFIQKKKRNKVLWFLTWNQ